MQEEEEQEKQWCDWGAEEIRVQRKLQRRVQRNRDKERQKMVSI